MDPLRGVDGPGVGAHCAADSSRDSGAAAGTSPAGRPQVGQVSERQLAVAEIERLERIVAGDAAAPAFPALAEAHEDTPPWERCCETHDRAYHAAGGAKEPHESYDLRLAADEALKVCVLETGRLRATDLATRYGLSEEQIGNAYKAIANTMFDAVRAGGLPCSGLSWRWGYGYPPCSRPEDTR